MDIADELAASSINYGKREESMVMKESIRAATERMLSEALDEYMKISNFALATLAPYGRHSGSCSSSCQECKLQKAYFILVAMVTGDKVEDISKYRMLDK